MLTDGAGTSVAGRRSRRPASGSSRSSSRTRRPPRPARARGRRRPGDPQGRPRRARRRGADRGRRRDGRAVGGGAQRRGLEGRAGREVAGPLAVHRPRGRQAGPALRGTPRSPSSPRPPTSSRWSPAPTSPSCSTRRRRRRSPPLDVPAAGRIVVVVGPEGGLTDEEVAAFVAAGAVSVRLGAEVLRTSTAGVARSRRCWPRTSRWCLAREQLVAPGRSPRRDSDRSAVGELRGAARRSRPVCLPEPLEPPVDEQHHADAAVRPHPAPRASRRSVTRSRPACESQTLS